jgi:hypothetical protein
MLARSTKRRQAKARMKYGGTSGARRNDAGGATKPTQCRRSDK